MSHVPGSSFQAADDRVGLVALVVALVGLGVAAVHPFDGFTYFLEIAPILLVAPLLVATRRRFPLTPLLMVLVAAHALVLELGGHYTYARVPIGDFVRDALGLARNHYDRFGHFMQGFVPAIATREILLRTTPLRPSKMTFFLVVCVCMAISASYEFIEWWTALGTGEAATDFLGTQGDPWDTQWDMAMATVGAISAQIALVRLHDRQLAAREFVTYPVL